jgi:sn-glycerol 3-phosphate transport system substrate-binding protein
MPWNLRTEGPAAMLLAVPFVAWSGGPHRETASTRPPSNRRQATRISTLVVFGLCLAACSGNDTTSEEPVTTVVPSNIEPDADTADDGAAPAPSTSEDSTGNAPTERSVTTGPVVSSTALANASDAVDDPPAGATQAAVRRCGTGPTLAPTTIKVWHSFGGDAVPFFEQEVARFEAEFPLIDIELEVPTEGWPGGVRALGALDVADRPDVLLGSEQTARLQVDSQAFVPIDECTAGTTPDQFTDLLPAVDAAWRLDGRLWAAPYNASTPLLMYDAKLWRDAGLDPDDPPRTLEQLDAAIRSVRDNTLAETGVVLYDRSASWLVTVPAAQSGEVLVEPANGRDGLDIDEVTLDQPHHIETLVRFRRLFEEGYVLAIGLNESGQEDLPPLVAPNELSGMTFHTSAALGDIYRLAEAGRIPPVEVTAAPFPGGGEGAPVGGGAFWIVDRGDLARSEASWAFVDWITQPDRVASLAAYTGYVPTTERAAATGTIAQAWTSYPAMRVGYDQVRATAAEPGSAGIQIGPQIDVGRVIEVAAIESIVTGVDPAEELRAAEDEIGRLLDEYEAIFAGSGGG